MTKKIFDQERAARMIKKSIKLQFITLIGIFLVFGMFLPKKAFAQVLSLDPVETSVTTGEEFTVNLNINTNSKAAAGADVKMTFDSTLLEVVKVENGDFFTEGASNIGAGTLYVAGYFREQFETKTGSGKLAILTLKGKAAGTARITFVCSAQTNDSNIFDANANDIINCTGITNGTYTIGAGTGGTTSTSPTPTGVRAATATPPVTGITLPTFFTFGLGLILIFGGIAAFAL